MSFSKEQIIELAKKYKSQGMDKERAWSEYVAESSLKPEIDAEEFYKIFESVSTDLGNELPDCYFPYR